jgi:hypothetical protein
MGEGWSSQREREYSKFSVPYGKTDGGRYPNVG